MCKSNTKRKVTDGTLFFHLVNLVGMKHKAVKYYAIFFIADTNNFYRLAEYNIYFHSKIKSYNCILEKKNTKKIPFKKFN